MLRPRLIPFLLIHKGGLVKTINFKTHKYIGDPLNAVKIFNEKEVDELMIVDMDASVQGSAPDLNFIASLAKVCRMPISYGGGIKSPEMVERIISMGVEKVAISSGHFEHESLLEQSIQRVGSQSVAVVLDIKKHFFSNKYYIYTHNGKNRINKPYLDVIDHIQSVGAGEIIINSIDYDGVMNGYNLELAEQIYKIVKIPMTVLGGAGDLNHIKELVSKFGIIGAAAGSFFVFKGKYKAVLIQYPNKEDKFEILKLGEENV